MTNRIFTSTLLLALLPWYGTAHADSSAPGNTTPNSVQFGYSYDHYSRTFESNPIVTLQYGRSTPWGSISLRANSGHRYQSNDTQYEITAYPKFRPGMYAELNIGTAEGKLFALNSQGAEIYSSLGNNFEGSLGVRHLAFPNSSVTIYTGSLSRYMGNYLLSLRPYVTPSNIGTSVSASLKLTRYFASADEYIRFSASSGKSPDERTYAPQIVTLRSNSIGISGQWSPRRSVFVTPAYTHERQELSFALGEYVAINKYSLSASYRF
jgi:YaiO family outer membrane protein